LEEMQMDKGQAQRVIETVWPWQATKPGGPRPEAGLPAVARGGIQAVIMGIIGFLLYRYLGHERMAYVVWSLALGVLASAVFLPPVFAAIEGFGRKLGPVGGHGIDLSAAGALLLPGLCSGAGDPVGAEQGSDATDVSDPGENLLGSAEVPDG
jgi:hypothetical protein